MKLIIKKPLRQGEEYQGKLYTRRIDRLTERLVSVRTITSVEGRKPGARPINGEISFYAFSQWLINNGLAKKRQKPEQMKL